MFARAVAIPETANANNPSTSTESKDGLAPFSDVRDKTNVLSIVHRLIAFDLKSCRELPHIL